jgi:tetratricopeptide (TPR) repeat protein
MLAMNAPRAEIMRLMQARDWQRAIGCIDRALSSAPRDSQWLLNRAQCLMALGRPADACQAAEAAQVNAPPDPVLFDAIGSLFSRASAQPRALVAFEQAVALAPLDAHYIFNRATVRRFLGQLVEAEADYDRVIALKPGDYEAYKNRSDLRTQSVGANHVDELESLLAQGIRQWQGEVQIRYALAKEYEDLGHYRKSFHHLQAGAKRRREHMRYDVAVDVATVDAVIASLPGAPSDGPRAGMPDEDPIFIVGLPRSGTTLVDRILGSHSAMFSAGELPDFALSIVDAVRALTGAAQLSRGELIARSADLDFAMLGQDYLRRARGVVACGGRFTDKMPLNYLYCGLIRRALPKAKIVHVTREPMAACFAMYKTLFEDGYPFSYDLNEIGRYYIAYRRLMDHWHATLPSVMYTLSYESLIADQRAETHRLLEFCGLEWQDACLEFHRNASATTTASAVQVRQPLYDSSVDQWRHYAAPLAPLKDQLRAAGFSSD